MISSQDLQDFIWTRLDFNEKYKMQVNKANPKLEVKFL
jgi:hypothetical protein